MPEFFSNGLKMHWENMVPDAARALQRVVVTASPASPANVLRLIYAHGDGPERMARGWPTGIDPQSGLQTFVADLPLPMSGKNMTWRPVLTSGAHEADPGKDWQQQNTAATPQATEPVSPGHATPQPKPFDYRLEYFARATAPLDPNPIVIGDTPDGLHITYPLAKGGTVIGPRINGIYNTHGGDWIRIRPDGMGVVGVRAVLTTSDGANMMTEYSGLVDFGQDGMTRILNGNPPARAEANMTPRFITAHPDWLWINRLQMIAFGRVTFATMLVEYDLYVMHSEAAHMAGENT